MRRAHPQEPAISKNEDAHRTGSESVIGKLGQWRPGPFVNWP